MKIALFSDVHANLPALEAFFEDVDRRSPDAVYCLGDLVGYNIWANEVVGEIRKRSISVISGSYDAAVGHNLAALPSIYASDAEGEMERQALAYTNSIIGVEERSYLRALPASIKLEYQLNQGVLNMLLVHGSSDKASDSLWGDKINRIALRKMKAANADIICFGNTHRSDHSVTEYEGRFLHKINIGSLGKPQDSDPRACYVVLTINEYSTAFLKNSIHAEFIRLDYNIKKAAMAIEYSSLPDQYAERLRNAT